VVSRNSLQCEHVPDGQHHSLTPREVARRAQSVFGRFDCGFSGCDFPAANLKSFAIMAPLRQRRLLEPISST